MARLFVTPIDLGQLELRNAVIQVLSSDPGSPSTGQLWFNSTSHTLKFYNGSATIVLGTLDQLNAPAADVSLNSHKITNLTNGSGAQDAAAFNQIAATALSAFAVPTTDVAFNAKKVTGLADPSGAQDAATKNYVDGVAQGLKWKNAVRAATTAAGTLATSFANGQTIDGVTLATGDRILIKNQATGGDNGLYVVAASGAPTRATDADTATELTYATVNVEAGTANADTIWTAGVVATLGTTDPTFVKVSSGTSYSAGNGLSLTGTTFAVVPGSGILADGTSTRVDTAVVARHFAVDVGDGAATSITVTHNLGTLDVVTQVYRKSDGVQVMTDVTNATTNTVTLGFATAPAAAAYRAVVVG